MAEPQTPGDYFELVDLAMDGERYDVAERIAREGMSRFPAAVGFHVLLGDVLVARHHAADAFYEFEWELLRVGPDRPTGAEAQAQISDLMTNGRGIDTDEIRTIADAVQKQATDPDATVEVLRKYNERRRDPFVLQMLLAEALTAASEKAKEPPSKEASGIYRDLLKRDPYFIPAYVELAAILRKVGRASEADALMEKAKSIDSEHWRLRSP